MSYSDLSPGKNAPDEINVIIEIPAHSQPVKYEVDKGSDLLLVDRFLSTSMHYPANYGYVPNTLSEDGDPVDVFVITPTPVIHGCALPARPVGMLKMTDESGVDAKILAVATDKITAGLYKDIQNINDVPPLLLKQIAHFFEHYKDLEEGKWVRVDGWEDKSIARKEIEASIERFNG